VSILKFFALLFNLNVNVYNCSNYCARNNFFERAMSAGISCKQVCGTWGGGGGDLRWDGGSVFNLKKYYFQQNKKIFKK
jgi:hypothetical protein